MADIRIAHKHDWVVGFGECPKCGRRYIGLTTKYNLSAHKTSLMGGKPCPERKPINEVIYRHAKIFKE